MVQIISDVQLDYNDVLIAPQTTSINHRGDVDVIRDFKKIGIKCCPIMNSNMTQTGTFDIAHKMVENGCIGVLHKFYTSEDIIRFFAEYNDGNQYFVTIGLRNKENELQKLKDLSNHHFSIMIDVPNAYIPDVEALVKEVRYNFPNKIIAVGNVCSGDITQRLIKAGATMIKIGVGPSAVCRTRHTTGCGRPQLSAVIECANAAHQVNGYVIADGGFNNVGDFCKAFVAGADICMSGAMFAGCDEAAGEVIEKMYRTNEYSYGIYEANHDEMSGPLEEEGKLTSKGKMFQDCDCFEIKGDYSAILYKSNRPKYEMKKFKEYYGMSSFRAQVENYGEKTKTGTSEGVESKLIEYTGPVIDTINKIKGGIRSCGSYIGATNIKHFPRQGSFYKVNRIQ